MLSPVKLLICPLPALSKAVVLCVLAMLGGCATEVDPGTSSAIRFANVEEGDVLSGTASVGVIVSSRDELGVEFYVGEELIDTKIRAPYEVQINTTHFGDGPHPLKALAYKDGVTFTAEVGVFFDNSGPDISMLSPANGSMLFNDTSGTKLRFTVSDVNGVIDFAVSVNGIPLTVGAAPAYETTLSLDALSISVDMLPLELLVKATATDTFFHSASKTFSLTLMTRLAWRFHTLGQIWAPPAVRDDGVLFLGSQDGRVYSLNDSGQELWQRDAGGQIVTSPVLVDTWVLVSAGNFVVALEQATGNVVWQTDIGSTVGTKPVLNGSLVLVGTYASKLQALNLVGGTPAWGFPVGNDIQSTPVILADRTAVFGSNDRFVYWVNSAGAELGRFETGDAVWGDATLASNGDVLVGSHDGFLYRFSGAGVLSTEFDARGQIWGSATEGLGGVIYIGSTFRRLYAVSSNLKNELWRRETAGLAYSSPALSSDSTIYIGATDGRLHAFSSQGTELWTYTTEGSIVGSAVVAKDGRYVFVGSDDRYLYALRTGNSGCGAPETVNVGGKLVTTYEVSRPDATNTHQGVSVETICSRPGVLPWTGVTWQEAKYACSLAGLDLCDGVPWGIACQGTANADFPYGRNFEASTCNGAANPVGGCALGDCAPMPTGDNAGCRSEMGLVDMSGNVREWTLDMGLNGNVVRGGGYTDSEENLACSDSQEVNPTSRLDDLGFRCCSK